MEAKLVTLKATNNKSISISLINKSEARELTVRTPQCIFDYKYGCAKRLEDQREKSYQCNNSNHIVMVRESRYPHEEFA